MEPRLSRRESQALTRTRLLEVASQEFFERGYRGTSLERVAERAGFSKGAVYSNFKSKEELVLAVLDDHFLHRLDALAEQLQSSPETIEARLATVTRWWEEMVGEQEWGVLIFELAANTRDKPDTQAQMADRELRIVAFIAALLTAETERFGVELVMPADDLATALVSLGSGLSFSRMMVPDTPTHVLSDLARVVLLGSVRTGDGDAASDGAAG